MELPPPPDGDQIHHRAYDVFSYRLGADRMMLRGIVHDEKPPGTYFDGDTEPLSVHHMVVDLTLDFPSLEIVEASVTMNVTPHMSCNTIEPDYQKLVGLSIARGFSRQIKDLFGRAHGCTHIGALLQAMAPVAIQSMWSMNSSGNNGSGASEAAADVTSSDEGRERAMAFNLNTCHIWAEDGENVQAIRRGEDLEVPVWASERLVQLGRSPSDWRNS